MYILRTLTWTGVIVSGSCGLSTARGSELLPPVTSFLLYIGPSIKTKRVKSPKLKKPKTGLKCTAKKLLFSEPNQDSMLDLQMGNCPKNLVEPQISNIGLNNRGWPSCPSCPSWTTSVPWYPVTPPTYSFNYVGRFQENREQSRTRCRLIYKTSYMYKHISN